MSEENQGGEGGGGAASVVNPDGTTNWKVVFDDPDQGVMAAVRAVSSTEQLRVIMTSVAQLLFKRKRDAGPRAEFQAKIADMLDLAETDGFETVQTRILEFLDAIKTFRIEKAALHAKNKETSQSVERRRKSAAEGPLARLTGNPVYLAIGIGGILAVLVVVVMLVVLPGGAPEDQAAEQAQAEQAAGQAAKPAASKPAARPARLPEHQMVVMKPILADILAGGERRRLSVVPLIAITEDDKLTPYCAISPRINEGVLIYMKSAAQAGQDVSDALLDQVASKIKADLNARSGGLKISRLVLVDIRKLPSDVASAANKGCERVHVDLNR